MHVVGSLKKKSSGGGREERHKGKPAAKSVAKSVAKVVVIAVAEAEHKPVTECLSLCTLAMDILSQPGLTHALLLYPGCSISVSIPKLCVTSITSGTAPHNL